MTRFSSNKTSRRQRSRWRTLTSMTILLMLATAGSMVAAGDNDLEWPSFRGPQASGVGDGKTVETWNGESGENILFKAEIPGLGHSSPVIVGDRIFLTTAVRKDGEASLKLGLYGDIKPVDDEGVHRFVVIALDRKTGELLWQQTAFEGEPKIKRHTKATHANSTPAADDERVVAFFGSEGLYAFDHSGKALWSRDFGVLDSGFFRVRSAQWGFASSPILVDDKVIVQVDVQEGSFVAALDAATGEDLWRTDRNEVPTWSTPAIAPWRGEDGVVKSQVVLNGWKHTGGYDLETGEELWSLDGGGDIPVPTPLYDEPNDQLILTSAHGPERPIHAIRTNASGAISIEHEAMAWSQEKAGNYMQTPILYDGLGYFCYDNGVLSVYDLETGERQSQQRLGAGKSGFTSSPVAADGKLYFTSEDGDTFVVRAGPEAEVIATNEIGESVMASPAVSDGVLYLRGRTHLFAIGAPE